MSTKLKTPFFRVSYPYVFEPKTNPNSGKSEWTCQMIFDIDRLSGDKNQSNLWDILQKSAHDIAEDRFGAKILADKKFKWPWKEGNDKDDKAVYPENSIFIESKTTLRAPAILDKDKGEILSADEFYAGCYARATVSFFAWEFSGKRGVSCGLFDIQKVAEGDKLTGGTSAVEDFGADSAEDVVDNFADLFGDTSGSELM
jgi:hypothetical protein